MARNLAERYAAALVGRSKLVVVLLLVLTAAVAAGAVVNETEDAGIGEFETDSEEEAALEYVEENYETDDAIVTQIVVRDEREGGDVLTRESLLEGLYLQRDARANESVNETLAEEGFVGLENVVAAAAVYEDRAAAANGPPDTSEPTLEEGIEALESRSDEEVEALLAEVLDPDSEFDSRAGEDPTEFLPSDYEPGETEAEARITFLFQEDAGENEEPEAAYAAQLEVESLFEQRFDDGFVFGEGITDAASASAVGDSFVVITPVALILVLGILAITYRDVVDVLLGLAGIAVVMAWLAGLMGWLEIPSSQLLIAVPFLLIGLSIDYALHVVMRYREARAGTLDVDVAEDGGRPDGEYEAEAVSSATAPAARGVRTGMALGVGGVVLALAAATFSTGVGFLSNVVSPLPAIQDFAILSAGGIFATFVAFGIFVPALKVEVDGLLENRFDRDRAKPAFGVTPGRINRVLSGSIVPARRAPIAVVAVALLLAVGGAYGATGIDTEFNEADFLPEDAPEWAKSFPEPFAPDTYTISEDAEYLGENFQDRGSQAEVVIRGDVTDPATLAAIEDARSGVAGGGTVDVRPDGSAAVDGPLSVLEDVAADNETVAAGLAERDTNDDGVPDEDLEGLYDLLYGADAERAATVLERTDDGTYESARLVVSVRGDAAAQRVADDTRAFASGIEGGAPVTAVATGGPVTTAVIQDALLETLIQAFVVTLAVILVFLTALYWVRHRTLSLGVVTLAPVVAALAWLLGTMAALGVPFNSETAVITSLAIGLGVDYSIHLGERFVAERERADSIEAALEATVTGTGGALLGSALTTAAGFGVLALALAPPLRRFGLVTGLSIVFAFVACLTVLPSLLVLRERVLGRE
ncbi:Predicted exporter protein, RND superfamily [Halobiforma haloterrestris]|uniref:Predicted exporter protein, RND superfamily n=1 Tax=Natronobacterium haloterrestre TaxID=148448 RepID=A0A1I1EGQ4_NATHA|nr:MMPL family transporter [Halobiforma haloterrestris]SFB84538.1 Predicted exporter protein, RND superfamily [Halobiforma haloterrestris]